MSHLLKHNTFLSFLHGRGGFMMTVDEKNELRLEPQAQEVWARSMEILAKRLPQPSFESWIRPIQMVEINGSEAVLAVANEFNKTWIGTKHLEDIVLAMSQILGKSVGIRIIVDPSLKAEYTPSIASIAVAPPRVSQVELPPQKLQSLGDSSCRISASSLNPKYTLDAFVVGSNNRFCHSAAMAVAESPGQAYNPLFLYGGVGLGKTHIMHAIGHHILSRSPNTAVRYITCERFTNELINSIRENRMIEFRKRYRQVDVLLVDDIQFIEGKESTQEEFFHTFNALRDSGRQIVLSSDRPPKLLSTLEERLRSRFEWGLITDIQPPDFETRLAILRKKCDQDRMYLPPDVLEYIATVFTNNIRELEGAVLKAHAYTNLTGEPLNVKTTASVLQTGAPGASKTTLTVERIIEVVAAHFRLDTSDLKSARRSQDLAMPRHIAMYLAHDLLNLSFPRIGQTFGNRKHTSALYAYEKVKEAIPQNRDLSEAVQQITRRLND